MKSADKLKKKIAKLTVAMKRHQVVPGKMIAPVTAANIAEKMLKQHKLEFKPEQILLSLPIASYAPTVHSHSSQPSPRLRLGIL